MFVDSAKAMVARMRQTLSRPAQASTPLDGAEQRCNRCCSDGEQLRTGMHAERRRDVVELAAGCSAEDQRCSAEVPGLVATKCFL